jgi:transposase
MAYYAGLDWGGTAHAVCIVDDAGRVIGGFQVRHDAEGIAELTRRLRQSAPAAEIPIAIERPSGLLVDSLVAAGYPIVPIHPNVPKACRPRYRAPPAAKAIPGTASCWPMSCAPMAIASVGWRPAPMRSRRCAP